MKAIHLLLLSLMFVCFTACDDNDENTFAGIEYLWTPSLTKSLIADGSVTLIWSKSTDMYTGDELNTKCFIANYISPDRFEIYQSDQPYDGFTKITEIKNNNQNVAYKVDNLQNGKPVYFRVKAIRKGYESIESGSFMFIPNPCPESKVIYSQDTSDSRITSISPDGKKISTISYEPTPNITYLSNLDGSDKITLNENSQYAFWSQDGDKFYFAGAPLDLQTGNVSLISYSLDTRETEVVKEGVGYSYVPSVSPDGNKVLYNRYSNGNVDLYLYDTVSGKDSLLSNGEIDGGQFFSYTSPAWVDDESYLIKRNMFKSPYTCNLSLMSLKDNKVEDLLTDYIHEDYAILSPDKKNIAFQSNIYNCPHLMLYNIESKTLRQLTGYDNGWIIYYQQRMTWKDNQTILFIEFSQYENSDRVVELSIR